MRNNSYKIYLVPIIAINIFIVLFFAAGYAYFTSVINYNTSNYQITMPEQTALVCTKEDCGVTITPAMMSLENSNSSVPKATSTCYLNCTCSGTPNAVCTYNVSLLETGDAYTPSPSMGGLKEFSVNINTPSPCNVENTSNVESHVYTLRNKVVSSCSLTVPSGGSISANISAEFKWYNIPYDQSSHALHVYQYQLTNDGGNGAQDNGSDEIVYAYLDWDAGEYPSVGDTVNPSNYETDFNNMVYDSFLKDGIQNNMVVETYACLRYYKNSSPIVRCVKSNDGSDYGTYTGMNASNVSSITNATGNLKVLSDMQADGGFTCSYNSTKSYCRTSDYQTYLEAGSNGYAGSLTEGSNRCEWNLCFVD